MLNSDKEREITLKIRALMLLNRSEIAREESYKNYREVCKLLEKYSDDRIEKMDWLEKEEMYAEAEAFYNNTKVHEDIIRQLDADYEELRIEANEFYGREVMPERKKLPNSSLDLPDPGDWWKN